MLLCRIIKAYINQKLRALYVFVYIRSFTRIIPIEVEDSSIEPRRIRLFDKSNRYPSVDPVPTV